MTPSAHLIAVALVTTFTLSCLPVSADSPGLQIRMTKKGLDYANSVAHAALSKELSDLEIPSQRGRDKNIEWRVTGIENRGVTIPSSSMHFDPSHNGLTWVVNGLGMDLHSTYWSIKYQKGWFKISTDGKVDLKVKRVSLRVTLSLGQFGGRPSVSMSRCQATVGDVGVYFYGGTAFILNLFRGIIGDEIKDLMQGEICKAARKLVNMDINRELRGLKVQVDLSPDFRLDYSLVSAPIVRHDSLELQNKGEIYWKQEVKEAPFSPKPFPDPTNGSTSMMYVWVSEFVANTAIHHAYTHGVLQYNVTHRDFPSDQGQFMNTTCSMFCVGNLIPQIGFKYPNSRVEANVSALGPPSLTITPEGISFEGNAQIDFDLISPEGDRIRQFLRFEMEVFFTVNGSVFHERLAGEIVEHRLRVKNIQTALGDIDPETLNRTLQLALDIGIVPGLNDEMRKGLDLPVTEVLAFNDAKLTLLNGSLLISTDVSASTALPTEEEIKEELKQQKQKEQQRRMYLLQQKQKQLQQQQEQQQLEQGRETTVAWQPQNPDTTHQPNHPPFTTPNYQPFTPNHPPFTTPNYQPFAMETEMTGNRQTTVAGGSSQLQGRNNAFCDRVINFCHASIDFCS